MFRNLILIILWLLFSSCSTTVDYHGGTNTFTTPEVIGKTFGITGQAGVGNSTKFEIVKLEQAAIFSSQINVDQKSGMVKDSIVNSSLGMGIGEKWEIYYRLMGDTPDPIGFKFQAIGGGILKKETGYKLLLFTGAGTDTQDQKTITATNGSGGSRSYSTNLEVTSYEYGLSFGYRFSNKYLIYTTPFMREFDSKAKLTSASYPTLDINKSSLIRGISLGTVISFGDQVGFMLETGYTHSQYDSSVVRDDYTFGLSLNVNSL